ncbi:MAG: CPBP family glutamic-type intramembrane protease [Anaerolineae bacterium]
MDQTFLYLVTALVFLFFLLIVVVANVGERSRVCEMVAYGLLSLAGAGMIASATLMGLSALISPGDALAGASRPSLLRGSVVLTITAVLSLLALLPPVRRLAARQLPLRAASPVNAVALSLAFIGIGAWAAFVTPLPNAEMLSLKPTVPFAILNELPLALAGILGVGLLTRRSWRQTWERLGMGKLTWRQALAALGAIVGLLVMAQGLEASERILNPAAYEAIESMGRAMWGDMRTPLAALLVSLASGTCEEILFRGALQPRLGLVMTSLLFAAVHTQYGVTLSLLSVLLAGVVLGLFRQRANTTACIMIHVLYNLGVFLLPGT